MTKTYDQPLKPLDAREFRFVEEYVCGSARTCGNAYQSAKAAGYSESVCVTDSATWVRDPVLKHNTKPHVFHAIQKRRSELEALSKFDANDIIAEIAKVARANAADFTLVTEGGQPYIDLSNLTRDQWAAIAETQVETYTEGRGDEALDVKRVRVKTHNKISALELLTKVHGLQKTTVRLGGDAGNPLQVQTSEMYDLRKLTIAEKEQLLALLEKARPDQVSNERAV